MSKVPANPAPPTTTNPYPKAKPRHWNAWKVGHRDAAAGRSHDPLGRGFSEIGLAMAYTKGYKALVFATDGTQDG